MDAKEYLKKKYKADFNSTIGIIESKPFWETIANDMEAYHQAKSKEEAEERFNKAVEDYFNTDSTKTVHENLHWAAFGKEEEG